MKSFLPLHSLIFSGGILVISTAIPITSVSMALNSVSFLSWASSALSSISRQIGWSLNISTVMFNGSKNITNSIGSLFSSSRDWDFLSGISIMSSEFQRWKQWIGDFSNTSIESFPITHMWEFIKNFWSWLFSESETNFNLKTILEIIKNDQFFNLMSAFGSIISHHPKAFSNMKPENINQLLKYFSEVATTDKQEQLTKRIKTIVENSKKIQNKDFGKDFGKLLKALATEEPQIVTFVKSLIDLSIDRVSNLLFSGDTTNKTKMENIKNNISEIIDELVIGLGTKFV